MMSLARHFSLFFVFSAGLALGLTSCGTMPDGMPNLGPINTPKVSGDPCKNADWFEVGRVDGLDGIPLHTSSYVGRCVSQGIPVNEELYNAGWQRGLVDYCTPERAYDAGRAGESYEGVCPKNLEAAFLKRFRVGKDISALEKKNALLELELDRKLSILEDAKSRDSEKSRQTELQTELKKLRDDLARNEHTIRELESSASL